MAYKPDFKVMQDYYRGLEMHPDGDYPSCAIRMSMTLAKVKVFDKAGYKKSGRAVSPHGWALRAEELYQWMRSSSVLGAPTLLDDQNLPTAPGIVYLRDCWARNGEAENKRTGDHLDLYYLEGNYACLMSGTLWPDHVSHEILQYCRDRKVRYWVCA